MNDPWLPQTSVHSRTSRLAHPSVLVNNGQKLVYGSGVPAPWNSTAGTPPQTPAPPAASGKGKEGPIANGILGDKGKALTLVKPALPDALLYATWDYDKKDYRQPLPPGRRVRAGSIQANSNPVLTLNMGSRSRQGSQGSKIV